MNKWRDRRKEVFISCRLSRFLVSQAFFSSLLSPPFCHLTVDEQLQLRRGENWHDIQWQTYQSVLIVSLLLWRVLMEGGALQWKTGRESLVLCARNCSSLPSDTRVLAPTWSSGWAWLSVPSRNWWAASVLTWHGFLSPLHISRTWPWAPSCCDLLWLPCSFYYLLGSDPSCSFVSDLLPRSDVWLLDPLRSQLLMEFQIPSWVPDFALAPSPDSPFPSSLHSKLCLKLFWY